MGTSVVSFLEHLTIAAATLFFLEVLFENAELLVERGEKLGVVGPNGCSKSTLLRMLMGTHKAMSG